MIDNKLIIAHRGASGYEKENTISSFKKALELKSDMIEFDLRKTKDGKIIVFHDEKIGKKYIRNMDYNEVKKDSMCEVPLFIQVLKILKGKIFLDIHIKEDGYQDEIIKLAKKYFKNNQIVICSEIPRVIKSIKEKNPEIKTGIVIEVKYRDFYKVPFGYFPRKKIIFSNADYIMPPWQIINKVFLFKAKKLNKDIFPWTINRMNLAKKLMKNDLVKGIISDIPDIMVK
jgi:glycerophosphoryl diester phosphodiesterase